MRNDLATTQRNDTEMMHRIDRAHGPEFVARRRSTLAPLFILLPLLILSCSGVGPDVIDPTLNKRTEIALVATNAGGMGEILRYSENQEAVVTEHDFLDANGFSLGLSVDAMYEAYDSLFLLSRESGTITVLDLATRRKLGELTGFGTTPGGGLCGLAFSNRSQAWAVSYGTHSLYLIDAYNLAVLPEIPLPGNPTAVGVSGTKVYVGMEMSDGRGGLAVLSSNAGGAYEVEQVLPFATPVIYVSGSAGGTQAFVITAGGPGPDSADPNDDVFATMAFVGTASPVEILLEFNIDFSPSLFRRIGQPPVWASRVYQDYLFVALPIGIEKVDMISGSIEDTGLREDYEAVGADYFSSLVYGMLPDRRTIHRIDNQNIGLADLTLPADARAVLFVSPSRVK